MTDAAAQQTPDAEPQFDAVAEAKQLLRTARWAALATLVPNAGYPFATLVNIATTPDGSPILLLSQLSAHRRHIAADPRISLLFYIPGRGDPLALPRLTILGQAKQENDPQQRAALRARFLARHPKSALYADFPDFAFFRVAMENVHLNGGFGRAAPLTVDQLRTPVDHASALIAAEAGALDHMNADHADVAALLAETYGGEAARSQPAENGPWRTIGLDPEGVDIGNGEMIVRVNFPQPISTSGGLRQTLVELAAKARSQRAPR